MTTSRTEQEQAAWTAAMKDLIAAKIALDNAQLRVADAIAVLRTPDMDGYCLASDTAIGEVLGISRQAVQQWCKRRGL